MANSRSPNSWAGAGGATCGPGADSGGRVLGPPRRPPGLRPPRRTQPRPARRAPRRSWGTPRRRSPSRSPRGGALLQLARRAAAPGNAAGHVVEDALAPLLLDLDALPAPLTSAAVLGDGVGEDVRVPADELDLDVVRHAGQVAGVAFGEHQGEHHDLQEQVAELAVLRRWVVAGDRVGQLVHLLDRVRDDVAWRLLAVPGALHAQHVDDALERDEFLAEQGVVEGRAGGHGGELGCGGALGCIGELGAGADEPPKPARQVRSLRPRERHHDAAGAARASRSARPSSSAGSISSRRPSPGSAASATSARSSPSRPRGTKTAPPPASARSEAAGASSAAAPMYASVRLIAASPGPERPTRLSDAGRAARASGEGPGQRRLGCSPSRR